MLVFVDVHLMNVSHSDCLAVEVRAWDRLSKFGIEISGSAMLGV